MRKVPEPQSRLGSSVREFMGTRTSTCPAPKVMLSAPPQEFQEKVGLGGGLKFCSKSEGTGRGGEVR